MGVFVFNYGLTFFLIFKMFLNVFNILMLKIKTIYFNIFLIEKYYTPHY